jgi:hypothetical protein
MITQQSDMLDSARNNELLWFAGAMGTVVGLAVWAYNRREVTYWDKTKQVAGQVAETASEINPWLGVGTAALGCAALAYSRRQPKSTWQKASEHADRLSSQTAKQLRPWPGIIASVAMGAASAAFDSKSRKRVMDGADTFANVASRVFQRLETIFKQAGKLYPQIRKVMA